MDQLCITLMYLWRWLCLHTITVSQLQQLGTIHHHQGDGKGAGQTAKFLQHRHNASVTNKQASNEEKR